MPTLAVFGAKDGRDKEKSRVAEADAALWLEATTSRARSELMRIDDLDWYVLQEPSGVRTILGKMCEALRAL